MAKHFHRGRARSPASGPVARRFRSAAAPLGPKGDRLWIHGVHPVLAALGNPERGVRRLPITSDQAGRLGPRLEAALAGRGGQPKPEIVERRALDNLLGEAAHQGIALDAEPLAEVFLEDLIIAAEGRPGSLLVVLD